MNTDQPSRNRERLCRPDVRNGFAFPITNHSFEGYALEVQVEAQPLKNRARFRKGKAIPHIKAAEPQAKFAGGERA